MSKPKFKRPAAKPFDIKDAKFLYFSACHNVIAKKPSVTESARENEGKGTLGSWRCSDCNKPCKVTRTKNEKPEVKQ